MKSPIAFTMLFPLAAVAAAAEIENEPIVVAVTRIPEDVAVVPAAVTVIGREELQARGVRDLRGALSLASGVDIAPGGDAGPASFVPEFWGVKEFDAFLLVVDGVPWGGAFNPALSTLDLTDVERIEVSRGAAPVMYGATSFVGVIHVIHRAPVEVARELRSSVGSYGSRNLGVSTPLPSIGGLQSAASADLGREGFRDPRTWFEKAHLAWRARADTALGTLKLSADGAFVHQAPASPAMRSGTPLSGAPLDSNQNMVDAFLNEDRVSFSAGLDHAFERGLWSTLASYSHSRQRALRGFLDNTEALPNTAHGFGENLGVTDLYFDSHARFRPAASWTLVAGVDHLHGRGTGRGGDFDYSVPIDGSGAPSSLRLPAQAAIVVMDQRDFSGLYGFTEWEPAAAWILEAGARLNRTAETRRTSNLDLGTNTLTGGSDQRSLWHGSGAVGATWKAWAGGRDLVNLFGAYRNTFKPGAVDFGLDTRPSILAPETAESVEAGAKTRWLEDRVDLDVSVFNNDFRNQVVATSLGGVPGLANAGRSRVRGLELGGSWRPVDFLWWRAGYSLHDAVYRDYATAVAGVPVQLAGRHLENAARNMGSTGLTYAPASGFNASTLVQWVGRRFLDKSNTDLAPSYATWSAGVGWRAGGWELRLDGRNLNDQRPMVAQSELGDSQYYLLPARRVDLRVKWNF